jgi:hypothetical protein
VPLDYSMIGLDCGGVFIVTIGLRGQNQHRHRAQFAPDDGGVLPRLELVSDE